MKKVLFILVCLISITATAQNINWGVKVKTNIKSFPVDTVFVNIKYIYHEYNNGASNTQILFEEYSNIYTVYEGKIVKTKVIEKQFNEQLSPVVYPVGQINDSVKARLAKKYNVALARVFQLN